MEEPERRIIWDTYVAHVLILAKQIKAEKAAKGIHSTGDFIPEALRLIDQKRERVLQSRLPSR